MSEFEKQDKEVMGLVNGEKNDNPSATPMGATAPITQRSRKGKYLAPEPEADEKAELQRQWLLSGIKIAVCAGGIAMLVGILKEPEMVPAVANMGVACFVGTASVILDRAIRKR